MQKLKRLLATAEAMDLIRPCHAWDREYLRPMTTGPRRGQLALRWSRGPQLRKKSDAPTIRTALPLEDDELNARIRELRDEEGKPLAPTVLMQLCALHTRQKVQRHVAVTSSQKTFSASRAMPRTCDS